MANPKTSKVILSLGSGVANYDRYLDAISRYAGGGRRTMRAEFVDTTPLVAAADLAFTKAISAFGDTVAFERQTTARAIRSAHHRWRQRVELAARKYEVQCTFADSTTDRNETLTQEDIVLCLAAQTTVWQHYRGNPIAVSVQPSGQAVFLAYSGNARALDWTAALLNDLRQPLAVAIYADNENALNQRHDEIDSWFAERVTRQAALPMTLIASAPLQQIIKQLRPRLIIADQLALMT